jgi:non-ribosomal peptide synthetase component E (peptide arylation enzyme)
MQAAKPFDIFISHSSKDTLAASAIKQHLQNRGLRCWKAPDDIQPGESWPQAIMRAISN